MDEHESPEEKWDRLSKLAHGVPTEESTGSDQLPHGLATNVAARWASGEDRNTLDLFERAARWSMVLSATACIATLLLMDPAEPGSAPTDPLESLFFAERPALPDERGGNPFY